MENLLEDDVVDADLDDPPAWQAVRGHVQRPRTARVDRVRTLNPIDFLS
jgi:hypothetical protein